MLSTGEIASLASKYQTPMYIFDKSAIKERVAAIRQILGDGVTVCYAMKANPFLVDVFKELDAHFEVCSPGEFAICEREHVDMSHIVLSGVNKELHDIEHAMDDCGGVGIYTIESRSQLDMINSCAGKRGITADVLLRVTSGNQFGLDEADIEDIAKNHQLYKNIRMRGLQCYSGTQKKKSEIYAKELEWLVDLSDRLCREYDVAFDELEYGPGLAYEYFGDAAYNNGFDELKTLSGMLKDSESRYHVTLEMGRYLASECGTYVTSIADIKVNKGQRYVIADGGINHVNYYGQAMAMKIPAYSYVAKDGTIIKDRNVSSKLNGSDDERYTVCGSLCTVADVMVKNLPIGKPAIGDMIIFHNIGAYSVTEGIYLFLSRRMPLILAVDYDGGTLKEEVYRDVLCTDLINSRELNKIF